MYWLLIETGSNQKYIFDTSKQRLQVAASAAIWSLGYEWIPDAIRSATETHRANGGGQIAYIDDPATQGSFPGGAAVIHVVKASGKAYLLAPTRALAIDIVRRVTKLAIDSNSGIDVWGYVSPDPIAADLTDVADSLRAAAVEVERQRYRRLSPVVQEPVLPFHQPCAYTGLPAAIRTTELPHTGDAMPRSPRAGFLFNAGKDARGRMLKKFIGNDGMSPAIARLLVGEYKRGDAFEDSSWIGVIHADGNGIGKIFTNLATIAHGEDFIKRQMTLSRNLEEITWEALRLTVFELSDKAPANSVLPILVGGDDVVAVVDGPIAAEFAIGLARNFGLVGQGPLGDVFRTAFQEIGSFPEPLTPAEVAERAKEKPQEPQQLSMAVGLLIGKPKRPFHHAVEVAESLTSHAKTTTRAEGSVAIFCHNESAIRPLRRLLKDASIAGACYLAEPLRVVGTGNGTVDELQQMLQDIEKVSGGTRQHIREALTTARTRAEADQKLRAAHKQAGHLKIELGSLGRIAIATTAPEPDDHRLYGPGSPTTFITAMELLDVTPTPIDGPITAVTA